MDEYKPVRMSVMVPRYLRDRLEELAREASDAHAGLPVSRNEVVRRAIERGLRLEHEESAIRATAQTDMLDRLGLPYDVAVVLDDRGKASFRVEPRQLPPGSKTKAIGGTV